MQHRPDAGGTTGFGPVGLLFLLLGVSVGIAGGIMSLLLEWPGLPGAAPVLLRAGQAHVPLLVFFAALPTALGGIAAGTAALRVGAATDAMPRLGLVGFGLVVGALALLAAGTWRFDVVASAIAANLLAAGLVLVSSGAVATMLVGRLIPYRQLSLGAWASLIASAFLVCAAPIAAAAYTTRLCQGVAPLAAVSGLVSPALAAVLCVLLGSATDIFCSRLGARAVTGLASLLGAVMLALLMGWGGALLRGVAVAISPSALNAALLLLLVPFEAVWIGGLRRSWTARPDNRLPLLFSAGLAIVLPAGLVAGLFGVSGHEAVSLAIVFGVLAEFFRMGGGLAHRPFRAMLARTQFGMLFVGALSLFLPVPPFVKAFGAGAASLSVILFAAILLADLFATNRRTAGARLPGTSFGSITR